MSRRLSNGSAGREAHGGRVEAPAGLGCVKNGCSCEIDPGVHAAAEFDCLIAGRFVSECDLDLECVAVDPWFDEGLGRP